MTRASSPKPTRHDRYVVRKPPQQRTNPGCDRRRRTPQSYACFWAPPVKLPLISVAWLAAAAMRRVHR